MAVPSRPRRAESPRWRLITAGGSVKFSRSCPPARGPRGRSPWSFGVRGTTCTKGALPSRKDSLTCRRLRSKAAWRRWSVLPRCDGGRHQLKLDPEREELRGIAADSDHARSGMRSDDGPEWLDHQRVGERLELSGHALRVGLRVRGADDETHALAGIDLARELDDAVQRSVKRAHALERRHEPVSYSDHRLVLHHRSQQCARATDTTASSQELEGRNREVRVDVRPHRQHATFDGRGIDLLRSEGRCHQGDKAQRHRNDFRVDDVHALGVRHVRGLARRLARAAQLLGDVDRNHRLVVTEERRVCLSETAWRWLRCRGVRRRGWELAIELLRRDVDAVQQRLAVEMKGERHHRYRAGGRERRREVRGGVGHDGHAPLTQLKWSSSMCLPSWRWNMRRSSGRIATRVTSTRTVVKIATL